jgi:hypothetical protein
MTRRGMPVPACGMQNDGHGVAIVWDRARVDCPMCRMIIDDAVPIVPGLVMPDPDATPTPVTFGSELPHRTPRVPDGAFFQPTEFAREHPRGRRGETIVRFVAAVLAGAALMTLAALMSRYTDTDPGRPPAHVIVTPHPIPTPGAGFTTMPAAPR